MVGGEKSVVSVGSEVVTDAKDFSQSSQTNSNYITNRIQKDDLYYSAKGLARALDRLTLNTQLHQENRDQIISFIHSMQAQGIKPIRLKKEIYVLNKIGLMLGIEFKQANRLDMERIFAQFEVSDYSEWSKQEFKIITKRFYKWLLGDEEYYPDCIRWIKNKEPTNNILPEDLLTEQEISSIVNCSKYVRDKAFISLLYESGARIGEMLSLKIKNVTFGEQVSAILVNGKTGQRRIPIIKSVPYLKAWLEIHPFKDNSSSLVWVKNSEVKGTLRKQKSSENFSEIRYTTAKKLLRASFGQAGVKKRCNPHIFRHSRATYLAKHLTEAQLKQFFGWTQSSDMAARYVHLSGRDLDEVLLKIG